MDGRNILSPRRALAVLLMITSITLCLPQAGQAAPKPLGLGEVEQIIAAFVGDLTTGEYEKAASTLGNLGEPYDADTTRKAVLGLNASGKPLYSDKIIEKEYGKTGKDVIYKVATKDNFLFLRFVLHKAEADNWIVGWFSAQTETQAPLPRVWSHIYP